MNVAIIAQWSRVWLKCESTVTQMKLLLSNITVAWLGKWLVFMPLWDRCISFCDDTNIGPCECDNLKRLWHRIDVTWTACAIRAVFLNLNTVLRLFPACHWPIMDKLFLFGELHLYRYYRSECLNIIVLKCKKK